VVTEGGAATEVRAVEATHPAFADAAVAVMRQARFSPASRAGRPVAVRLQVPVSFTLERAIASFPDGSFHVAVVDPGVGTDRRLLAVSFDGATVVCPDNGLITWPWRRHRGAAHKVVWRPDGRASHTFHGRDVLAPVVGMLAAGRPVGELCEPIADPVLLDVHLADARVTGQVIHVDRFGNATTNIPEELLRGRPSVTVRVGSQTVGPVRRTYADAAAGRPLVLIGSSGLLEIAVRDGSAARVLGLRAGDEVFFE